MKYLYPEFYEVHGNRLESISRNVARLVIEDPDITVRREGPAVLPEIVQTGITPQVIQEAYGGRLNQERAEELAEINNATLLATATKSIFNLDVMASMYDETMRTMRGESSDGLPPTPLQYDSAGYQCTSIHSDLGLQRTLLEGLDSFGTAEQCEVEHFDGPTVKRLAILRIGNEIIDVAYNFGPSHDVPRERWAQVLGPTFNAQLMLLAAGNFGSEEDLDATLTDVRQSYHGTAQEQEVGPLLAEIRDRARAAKQSLEFTTTFGMTIPPVDYLADVDETLRHL